MAKTEQEKPAEKAAVKGSTTTVDLASARVYHGTAYGPGEGIAVPEAAAKKWAHEDAGAPKKKSK